MMLGSGGSKALKRPIMKNETAPKRLLALARLVGPHKLRIEKSGRISYISFDLAFGL